MTPGTQNTMYARTPIPQDNPTLLILEKMLHKFHPTHQWISTKICMIQMIHPPNKLRQLYQHQHTNIGRSLLLMHTNPTVSFSLWTISNYTVTQSQIFVNFTNVFVLRSIQVSQNQSIFSHPFATSHQNLLLDTSLFHTTNIT